LIRLNTPWDERREDPPSLNGEDHAARARLPAAALATLGALLALALPYLACAEAAEGLGRNGPAAVF
jgi:hypothetical protein